MEIKLKKINDFTKELKCVVSWEEIKDSFINEFNKVKSNHTPKGGRKGKVFGRDLELFKKNYGTAIEANFAEKSLNEYYQKAIQEKKLNPINQAQVSNLEFSEGNSLEFTLSFEIVPEIKLPNYEKKFKIKMIKYKSSKEDVDHALEEVRQQHSNLKTVDDGAKSGNFIMGDFQELDDSDFPIIGKKLEKQYIKLGIGAFTGATEKELIGAKPDDKRKITVDYGEGKKSKYELHIHKVEEQLLPELNDELAKTVSPDLKKLSDLKEKLKDNIQKSIDDDYEKRKREELINYFVEKTKLKAPESMVSRYLDKFIEDQMKKNNNLDKEKLRKESQNIAEFNVKWFIIKDSILEKSKVSVTDKDLDKEIKKMIDEGADDKKKILDFFAEPQNRESLHSNLINEKLFDYMSSFAIIKDTEKSTAELRKQQ
ncbi:MAG: trigger factor [Candidatus Marinimicrobia bacterium]|nr:trigger factor [Candidatus Neomarinimicrobiota bacterium]|tara:strand:- start:570 stop:1847 length:1278 start_codon:yes stop_codon:yes gene_type:complete